MSEFNIRSESVDVEQIMQQIRQRILEKRGADYTEDQIRELASVRLEKFLDPKNLRSDLLEQFRKSRPTIATVSDEPPVISPPYAFDDQTLFTSHRGVMRFVRRLLRPFLKLMFNPNTLNQILHTQAQFNVDTLKRQARQSIEMRQTVRQLQVSRGEWNALYYEVLHNIVLETTRMGIEVQNQRMKLESLSSRLDFSERRVRALEGVVQYRPEVVRSSERHAPVDDDHTPAPQTSTGGLEGFVPAGTAGQQGAGDGSGRKRRRRRRGRRGGQGAEGGQGASGAEGSLGASGAGASGLQGPAGEQGFDNGEDDENGDDGESGEAFDVPEPLERPDALDTAFESRDTAAASDAPQAPQASAFAPEESNELRRDKPGSSEDDLQ